MSEFFHNLSWQALTNDNNSVQVKFEAATELVKSINHLIQKQVYETKKKKMEIGKKIVEQLTNKEQPTIKTEIEQVEENIVNDIITNDQTGYAPAYSPPTVKTEEEIDEDRKEWNKNLLATEIAWRERDLEIIDDIDAKKQVDLIRSAVDPSDGLLTNEEVDQTDCNRTQHNEPLVPQLDSNVLNVIREVVNRMSDKVNAPSDKMPALEDIPENKYAPPEVVKPNIQDILTEPEPEDFVSEMQNLRDEVKQGPFDVKHEVDPLENIMPEIFTDEHFDDTDFVSETIAEFRSDQNKLDLDVRARVTNALVPAEIKIESDDPADILADPNVTTILPPTAQEPYNNMRPLSDMIAPVAMAITPEQSDGESEIDFQIWRPDDLIPAEFDENKIQLRDDGDVFFNRTR